MRMSLEVSTFSYQWFRTKTRFEAEAKDNPKMVYCNLRLQFLNRAAQLGFFKGGDS